MRLREAHERLEEADGRLRAAGVVAADELVVAREDALRGGGEARAEGPLDVEDVALELLDRPERRCVQAAPRPYSGSARRTRRRGCGG